jgi:hypothetical protein
MVRTKIATKLDTERTFDVACNFCDNNDVQGRTPKYKMDHPEKVVFVDETGANTNQGKGANISGMKMLTTKSGRSKERSSFQDCHWTTIG